MDRGAGVGLQSMGSQRVRHNLVTKEQLFDDTGGRSKAREGKGPAQHHTVCEWQSQNWNPDTSTVRQSLVRSRISFGPLEASTTQNCIPIGIWGLDSTRAGLGSCKFRALSIFR